jgi:retron-type reverse transcriptase
MENLLISWQEFLCGKRRRADIAEFSIHFLDSIVALHNELRERTYCHGPYQAFKLNDPKPRHIHKASVRDRLVHHAVYRILYPYFDRKFIFDSYSCRNKKGTHRAMQRLGAMAGQVSRNHTRTCWVLQCDVRKFFASIDQAVLISILGKYISNHDILWLLENIILSFQTAPGKGLPLGNLTSQLFVNVYMNEFDQFVKRKLKVKYYIRYADDFVILSNDKGALVNILPTIKEYLLHELCLTLHPNKVSLRTFASGIDFLGWVSFPHHRVLRTTTKRGMFRRFVEHPTSETLQSYLGLLQHGNTQVLKDKILKKFTAKEKL